jgi:hypothetical protein
MQYVFYEMYVPEVQTSGQFIIPTSMSVLLTGHQISFTFRLTSFLALWQSCCGSQAVEWLHGIKTRLKTHGPLNRQLTLYWTRKRRDRFNPLKPKLRERWERQMKSKFKEEMKGRSERYFIFRGGRKNIVLLEGSQATPARPSGGNNVKVNTLW